MTEDTAQDAAQPGRPWWRVTLPTAVAGSVTALALTVSFLATPQADASHGPQPLSPHAATQETVVAAADLAAAPDARAWQVVAHRGGTVWGPEHTRPTFDHLLEAGADAVEFDVRFTRDKVPGVFHDADLERTTDCAGPLAKRTLAQLQRCDSGSWFAPPFRGARVLTLDAVLSQLSERSPALRYYVHMKRYSRPQAAAVVAALRRHGLNDGRATVVCNRKLCLHRFSQAGATRLGHVFCSEAGWDGDYPVLIPYDVPLRPDLIRAAQQRGQVVLGVAGHGGSVREFVELGLDGVMADDLDAALRQRPS